MKTLLLLTVLFAGMPFLAQAEESGIKVQTGDGTFEVKTGNPPPAPNPQVIVVRPPAERTTVVQPIERTTVVQPSGGGCSLQRN